MNAVKQKAKKSLDSFELYVAYSFGQGVLGQVGMYTGLSRPVVQALVFGIVTFNYLAAVNPR